VTESRTPPPSAFRLLTRLFVRRFIEIESLSPHVDRLHTLAVVYGLVITMGVFYTFFLCVDSLSALVQLPGPAAVRAVPDRFMYIAASMAATALATLAVWDALALESRDAAILGPLPVSTGQIARAKLTAAAIFAALVTLLLNAAPAVLYPAFLTLNMRGVRGSTLLALIAAQSASVALAGLFGFVSTLAVRGLTRATLGERVFGRVSTALHSTLLIVTVVALLLVPTVRASTVRAWVAHEDAIAALVTPVLWFLGVNESMTGRLLVDTPVVLPPRLASYPVEDNAAGRAAYLALLPALRAWARPVWWTCPLVALTAIGAFLWTNRRMPEHTRRPARARRRSAHAVLVQALVCDPEVQAGLHFAWQVFARSRSHRTVLAAGVAIGATHACLVVLRGGLVTHTGDAPTRGAFAIGLFLLGTLVVAARYAFSLPATPAAGWLFQIAWHGDDRPYLSGVKGALHALVGSILLLLLPLHILFMGLPAALAHSGVAWLLASVLLDAQLLAYRRLPFACSYIPIGNPKVAWPAGLGGLLAVTYLTASMEHAAASSPGRWLALGAALGLLAGALMGVDRSRRLVREPVSFNEPPPPPTQRLGLYDHVFGSE
jgi:hypothetical protein